MRKELRDIKTGDERRETVNRRHKQRRGTKDWRPQGCEIGNMKLKTEERRRRLETGVRDGRRIAGYRK